MCCLRYFRKYDFQSFAAIQVLLLVALVQLSTSIEIEEVKPRWIYNGSTRSLPDSIEMDLELRSGKITLNLLKQTLESNETPLIINGLKGQRSTWKQSEDELLGIYKDSSFDAKATVAIEKVGGNNKTHYMITFSLEEKSISLLPKAIYGDDPSLDEIFEDATERASNDKNTNTYKNNKNKLITINGILHSIVVSPRTKSKMDIFDKDILSGMMRNTKIKKRSDHQPDKELMTIEIFTVIDNSILKNFLELSKGKTDIEKKENAKKSILFIFTHIMEGVKNAYENIKSEKYKFTTKWVGALIAEDSKEASFIRYSMLDKDLINGTKILFNMMSWVSQKKRERNVNKRLPKFDFLAAFTRYLVKFGPILQPGLAGRNKMCSDASPAIIRYTNVVETIRILSHELAHALNADHDGRSNACKKKDGFIMGSHELDNSRNESRNFNAFSDCAISSFEGKIEVLKQRSNCLINEAEDFNSGQEKDIFLQLQPGQIYDLDDQCKLTYGPESFYIGGSEKDKDVCAGFNCDKGFIRGAMGGTMCLNGAWCLKGRCTPDSRAPRVPEHCIKGDSKLPLELESAELKCKDLVNENRELCENETVKSHCCLTCSNINNQTWNGECHDVTDECASLEPRDCYNEYYATTCCNTCRNLVKNPSDANCLYGDKGVNCSSLVPEVCHISTRYCCQTCADYLTPTTLPTSSINNTTTYSETTNVSKIFNALLTDSENGSKTTSLPSTTSSPKKLCPKKQTQKIPAAN